MSANYLVAARLSKQCVAESGVVAVTNTAISLMVRGAFETVFGFDGFLGELVYQTRSGGGNDSKYMSVDHETVLIFSKNPSAAPRFTIPKTEDELRRYSKEDKQGRYYWDTFIRKQARNYYPITCPDGSVLETDEDGNKVSWLWSEKTFRQKLSEGEVEIRNVEGKWKLYYKVRVTENKILRSVILQKDHLSEIFDEYPEGIKGDALLTTQGTKEVKKYRSKPEYLKSSKYYEFVFNALAKNASNVLVPFPRASLCHKWSICLWLQCQNSYINCP